MCAGASTERMGARAFRLSSPPLEPLSQTRSGHMEPSTLRKLHAKAFAAHTQPSCGFLAEFQRDSRTSRTRGVIGITRRAAAVLPRVINSAPSRPLTQVTSSHPSRKHSSGRIPVSARTEATEASGSGAAARYLASAHAASYWQCSPASLRASDDLQTRKPREILSRKTQKVPVVAVVH
jgi:hypothetical protein